MVQLASEAVAQTRAVKLIVLDRDGVINHDSDQFIKSPDEWRPIPGSLEAIARLNHAGFRVVVATNQSGIGRGLFDMATLNAIHEKMHKALAPGRRSHRRALLLPAHGRFDVRMPQAEARDAERDRHPLRRRPDRRAVRRRLACATCRPPRRSARSRCWC